MSTVQGSSQGMKLVEIYASSLCYSAVLLVTYLKRRIMSDSDLARPTVTMMIPYQRRGHPYASAY